METNNDFAKYISKFLTDYLPYSRNVSQNTIKLYSESFIQFLTYMKEIQNVPIEKIKLKDLTRDNVTLFLRWIITNRKCSNRTRNCRLAAMSSFAKFLQYEDVGRLYQWQQIMGIPSLKVDKKIINHLSLDGIKLILEQPDVDTRKGRRDLALIALMYDTGARIQEIIDLMPSNLKIEYEPYTVKLTGKGSKSRIVPLMNEQIRILKNYMMENHLNCPELQSSPLFFNSQGAKLTRAGVTYILHIYVVKARTLNSKLIPDNISCHSLRHSKAMHLLQSGVNLVYIRDFLGHCSIKTTEIYARADSKQKREAFEKAYVDLHPENDSERLWEKDKNLLEWLINIR